MTKQDKKRFFPKVNNIEYIEREISEAEENIDIHKFILSEATDDKDKENVEVIIQIITENLEHLQQIKDILEAWEVAKEELQIVFKGKNYYGEPLRRYELNVIGQNKIDTLNKALEVSNNE